MDLDGALNDDDARRREITRGMRRSDVWEHPFRGVSRPVGAAPDDPVTRLQNVRPLLPPEAVLTGWAGAYASGVRYLNGFDRWGRPMPIVVALPAGMQLRPRPGFVPSRRRLHRGETHPGPDGVATLARCAYDLALDAPDLTEAVVALDMCTSTTTGDAFTSLGNVVDVVARHKKTRGIVQAREAVVLASSRSASPWESRTRMLAVLGAGIEPWVVNVPVFDLAGRLLGIADMLHAATGLVIESDGSGHREASAHQRDNVREERFERAGCTVVRVTSLDHRDLDQAVRRIRSGYAASLTARKKWTLERPAWWHTWPDARRWE